MTISLPLLDRIDVASPCSAKWDEMTGDDKRRFCSHCNLHVHNLSAMTRDEAESLLAATAEGRLCTRFYQRADGTILTQDCPVGMSRARARLRRAAGRIAAAVGLVGASSLAANTTASDAFGSVRLRALRPFAVLARWIAPAPPPPPAVTPPGQWLAGARAIRPLSASAGTSCATGSSSP